MIQISDHYSLPDFQKEAPIPAVAIPSFSSMANLILEPIYEEFGVTLYFTSGYRNEAENTAAHGQPNSEHKATADYCAVDFFCVMVEKVFDWMCQNPNLPYHQLILEKGKVGSVIHVSWNRLKPGVRSVLTGATNNSQPYEQVAHVEFNPSPEVQA
jgi:Peptidase M15